MANVYLHSKDSAKQKTQKSEEITVLSKEFKSNRQSFQLVTQHTCFQPLIWINIVYLLFDKIDSNQRDEIQFNSIRWRICRAKMVKLFEKIEFLGRKRNEGISETYLNKNWIWEKGVKYIGVWYDRSINLIERLIMSIQYSHF